MGLVDVMSNLNNEIKLVLLGNVLNGKPKTAKTIKEEIDAFMPYDIDWDISDKTIRQYLDRFVEEDIIELQPRGLGQYENLYSIKDERYQIASRHLAEWVKSNNISMYSIFGLPKPDESMEFSSISNRLSIMDTLFDDGVQLIANISRGKFMHRDVTTRNLESLAESGMIDKPEISNHEGNTYKINVELHKYFLGLLGNVETATLGLIGKGPFTKSDIVQAADTTSDYSQKRINVLIKNGIISSHGTNRLTSYRIRFRTLEGLENAIFEKYTTGSDRILYELHKNGYEKGDSLMAKNFHQVKEDLRVTKPAITLYLNNLEKAGVITRDVDCKQNREYSLSQKGEDFWRDQMRPIHKLFGGQQNGLNYPRKIHASTARKLIQLYDGVRPSAF